MAAHAAAAGIDNAVGSNDAVVLPGLRAGITTRHFLQRVWYGAIPPTKGQHMRRREFITLLGGAATWPLAARAQQGERVRRIGVLLPAAADDVEYQARLAAFYQGLALLGWTNRPQGADRPALGHIQCY